MWTRATLCPSRVTSGIPWAFCLPTRRILGVGLLLLTLVSCTSIETLPARGVSPGETVIVHLNDGSKIALAVQSVTADEIIGVDRSVPIADVASVEIKRFDAGKTVALGGGILALFLISLQAFEDSVADVFDSIIDGN